MYLRRLLPLLLLSVAAYATVFGSVRGLVHDAQHRPVAGTQVTLQAASSAWQETATSNDLGEFRFEAVPVGAYTLEVNAPGFASARKNVVVNSGRTVEAHFALAVPPVTMSIEVRGEAETVGTSTPSASSIVSRQDIARTPGADRTNSLAMVTDYVPGAVIVHDQLHIRGGHQFTWTLDGIPVPNTNIASNVGPQFDPKDIDYLEVQRGGLSAEYGDRAFGVLNVVTRSGIERSREAELVASYGSFNGSNDQLNFGDHSERFAYYGSISGNRSDLGLETPTPQALHDLGAGLSGFASLIFNKTPNEQLRSVISVRGDHYQVPNTPEQQVAGVRDVDNERDVFASFSWARTAAPGVLLTVAPFYHFNRAHYQGSMDDNRSSSYSGGVLTLGVDRGRHNARAGAEGFAQYDTHTLALNAFQQSQPMWGSVAAVFAEDQFKLTSWLTLDGGVRVTHFSGGLNETAADPRAGAVIRVPRLKWTLRGFYGRYYEPPPLFSVGGPVLELAAQQGFGFLPLKGERDEQREFGLTIPVAGWSFDLAQFHSTARNFFDHDALGNSNIFFPLTIERARIHGYEAMVHSPRIAGHATLHLAYSRQWVQGRGGVTGGLTDFSAPGTGYYYLDHDQRDTLTTGAEVNLPLRSWMSANLNYGSGFLNGDGPQHLPPHTTLDLRVGKSFRERWTVQASALNLADRRYLLDNSNTFGGTHYARPRELALEVRYRFKY